MIGIKKEERHFRIYINYLKTTARKKKKKKTSITYTSCHRVIYYSLEHKQKPVL